MGLVRISQASIATRLHVEITTGQSGCIEWSGQLLCRQLFPNPIPEGADTLVNGSALRSPIYIDARDIAVTKIVPESNVFISLRIASSEKQIPRFVGNVSS
jgi:hypothetical protein